MEGLGKALKKQMEVTRPPKLRSGNLCLDSKTRVEIYQMLIESPGMTIPNLARTLDKGESTIRWHIRKMEKAEVVGSSKSTGKVRYSPVGVFSKEVLDILDIFNDGGSDVLLSIEKTPGSTRKELMDLTNISKNRLDRKLLELHKIDLIRKVKDGPMTRYFISDGLTKMRKSLDSEMKGSRDRLAQVLHNEVPSIFSLSTRGSRVVLEGQFGVVTFRFPF